MSRTGLFVVCPDTEKDYTLKGAVLYFMMAMLVVKLNILMFSFQRIPFLS